MASAKAIADKAHEQQIQILSFQNSKLSEQLATQKEQIRLLEDNVHKYEEEKKKFSDTLLCVNRIWQQFNRDIKTLCARNDRAPDAAGTAAAGQADAAMADAAAAPQQDDQDGEDEQHEPLVWDSFDPFLARLLQGDAASSNKLIKKHTQAYLSDLSTVEEALHARAAAGLEALGGLLDAIQDRSRTSAERQEALRQLSTDQALTTANQQLQEEVTELQEQLDAATALQRSTQVRERGALINILLASTAGSTCQADNLAIRLQGPRRVCGCQVSQETFTGISCI